MRGSGPYFLYIPPGHRGEHHTVKNMTLFNLLVQVEKAVIVQGLLEVTQQSQDQNVLEW